MPELPDVEVLKRYCDSTALHQEIESVEVKSDQIIKDIEPSALRDALQGQSFASTRRHGKHLFLELDGGECLALHFGMTGNLEYFQDMDKEPEYDQLLFSFSNGYHLAYEMPRKLGAVRLVDDTDEFIQEKQLGPDALEVDWGTFKEALSGKRAMAKSTLMNQSVIAGLGNVYSDEILFQAEIHPRTELSDLDEATLRELFESMKEVLETAIDRQAAPNEFPDDYLVPRREEGSECPRCSGTVEKVKVSGRSGYYCPECQRKYDE